MTVTFLNEPSQKAKEAIIDMLRAEFDWICEDWDNRAGGIPDPCPKKTTSPKMENQNVEVHPT